MNRRGFLGMLAGCLAIPFARASAKASSLSVRDDVPAKLPKGCLVINRATATLYSHSPAFAARLHEAIREEVARVLAVSVRTGGPVS